MYKNMSYEEYERIFSSHHTCGIPHIPYNLAYSSDCPMCEPTLQQWRDACRRYYDEGIEPTRFH